MDRPPYKKGKGDITYDLVKGILSVIPTLGSPASVLLDTVFTAPLDKRKQEWLERLADDVTYMQEIIKDLTPEKLSKDQAFVTVALQASQIAIRNHQKEKIEALSGAVLNSVLPNAPEEDQQLIFLRLIDHLTPWHLRVLALTNDPVEWMMGNGINIPSWTSGSLAGVICHCFPELKVKGEFCGQVIRDLLSEGLLEQGINLNTMMTGGGVLASRTTITGKTFLRFIARP